MTPSYRSRRSSRSSSRFSGGYGYGGFAPYVSVGERRAEAEKAAQQLSKKGKKLCPVSVVGRDICHTWWGLSWCRNLEGFGDYENRLPRGRSYLRHGAVIDLNIESGLVKALVQGSRLYEVQVEIKALPAARKQALCERCASDIGSAIDLLSGKLDREIMKILAEPRQGLFPEPGEITFTCSCPDYAGVCKHVAATLYGIGVRFDSSPELFFRLRDINPEEFAASATAGLSAPLPDITHDEALAGASVQELGSVFGIDFDRTLATRNKSDHKPKPAVQGSCAQVSPLSAGPGTTPRAGPARARTTRSVQGSAEDFVASLFDPITGKTLVTDEPMPTKTVARAQKPASPNGKATGISSPQRAVSPSAPKRAAKPTRKPKANPTKTAVVTVARPSSSKRQTTDEVSQEASPRKGLKTTKKTHPPKAVSQKKQPSTAKTVTVEKLFKPRQIVTLADLKELDLPYSAVQRALLDGHLDITAWRGEYRTTRTTISWLKRLGAI